MTRCVFLVYQIFSLKIKKNLNANENNQRNVFSNSVAGAHGHVLSLSVYSAAFTDNQFSSGDFVRLHICERITTHLQEWVSGVGGLKVALYRTDYMFIIRL